jgi:antibiotic biosynthesis monooxygenase (ABM) superfamily enzyme
VNFPLGAFFMEQLAQKTARRATLPPLPSADKGGNFPAYYYVEDPRGRMGEHGKCLNRIQYMWLTCDESGWANAAQQMMRKSQTDRFVAWYDSPEGRVITESEGSAIAYRMHRELQDECQRLFPVKGINYEKPRQLPYLTPHTLGMQKLAYTYVRKIYTADWMYSLPTDEEQAWGYMLMEPSPFEATAEANEYTAMKLMDYSQRDNFLCWTHSPQGEDFFHEHQATLRMLYSQEQLQNSFGSVAQLEVPSVSTPWVLPKGYYVLPNLTYDGLSVQRFYYLLEPNEVDEPQVEFVTLSTVSGNQWPIATLLEIANKPGFVCWTNSETGAFYLLNHYEDLLRQYPNLAELTKIFGEAAVTTILPRLTAG